MSHTPGPWTADADVVGAPSLRFMAIVHRGNSCTEDEHLANLALLSSAPTLLSALQMARALLDLEAYMENGPAMSVIDSALSKAQGKPE